MAKGANYFEMFVSGAEFACEACAKLDEVVQNLPSTLETVDEVHKIENAADVQYRELISALDRDFITPLEREDIMRLAQAIDDVVDGIEDICASFYMLKITQAKPDTMEFIELIDQGCATVLEALKEFGNFRKSKTLRPLLIKISEIEGKGDKLYQKAVRSLFEDITDTLEIIKWHEIFNIMERCCDSFEEVADVIESVMMKNS